MKFYFSNLQSAVSRYVAFGLAGLVTVAGLIVASPSSASAHPSKHICSSEFGGIRAGCLYIYASNGNMWVGGQFRDDLTDGHCVTLWARPVINNRVHLSAWSKKSTNCSSNWKKWSLSLHNTWGNYDAWDVSVCRSDIGWPGTNYTRLQCTSPIITDG